MSNKNLSQKTSDSLRQFFNFAFALSQIIVAYLPRFAGIGTDVGAQSAITDTPVIPATYAFIIWAPIFALFMVYAIWQALPWERNNPLFRRIGTFTAIAFLGCTVWQLLAEFTSIGWPTAVVIVCILVMALRALMAYTQYRKENKRTKTGEFLFVYLPVSIFAGWVTAATFANISSALHQAPFFNFGLDETYVSIFIIAFAGLVAGDVTMRTKGNVAYVLAVAWALVAILAAYFTRESNFETFAATALMLVYVIYRFAHVRKII